MLNKPRLEELVGDDSGIEVYEASGGDGSISALELIAMIKLIKTHNPHRLFELGTLDDQTPLNMAANSPCWGRSPTQHSRI